MNHKLLKIILLIVMFLGWLFYLYQTTITYINISISDNYNAFSEEDIKSFLFTLVYGIILSFLSIFITILYFKSDRS